MSEPNWLRTVAEDMVGGCCCCGIGGRGLGDGRGGVGGGEGAHSWGRVIGKDARLGQCSLAGYGRATLALGTAANQGSTFNA